MKIKLLFFTFLVCSIALAQNKGIINGTLTDKDANNAPLAFANAIIKGTTIGVTTDEKGQYSLSVTPGDYTIQFSYVGYENVEVAVKVTAGETITIDKVLGSGSYKLEDVVVQKAVSREKETALLLDQKKAVEMKQSIGAQEMSRKGISDVEEGLTKITGISKVESRGLFVRGLEDRYNYLLINDLQAPSNSPYKKIIPLDLFPTDIVGVLSVYKTFNPNISGDFAGATVNIETIQSKSITKLTIGAGYTTNNNGEDFLISSDANTTQGFLGLVGKDRELPSAFGSTPSAVRLTPEQYKEGYAQNSWNVDESKSPLNTSIGILHAEKFNLKNGNSFNYTFSINGENKSVIRKGFDRTILQGSGNYDNNLYKEEYKYQTNSSALIGLKYKAKAFDISSTTFYLRSTESKIQDQLGYTNNQSTNPNILIRLNQFEQSDYFNSQLYGNLKITSDSKHTLKAGGSFVKTSFQQPDRKFIIGEKVSDTEINTSYGGNHLNRQYLDVKGNYYMSGLLEYNFKFKEKENGKSNRFSIGYNVFRNDLTSTYRILAGARNINKNYTAPLNTLDSYIVDDINNGIIFFREESNADYKVKLNQFVNAGYVNVFFNFGKALELNGGVRFESSNRQIKYREFGDGITDPYRKRTDDKLDILPSLNAKYALKDNMNLRLSASKTMTRPVTMELLPIQYISADGKVEKGNADLKNSENYNVDLKYELFPTNKELFAIGVFGKQINDPIERVFIAGAGGSGQLTTFANSKQATLFGAEIEMLVQLNRIHESLKNFSFGFNTSLLTTNVDVDFGNTSLENEPNRDLQGASPWIVNSDLKYEFELGKEMKNTMSLVYGVYGDRIFAVGGSGVDHIYEKSFHKLDFVWASKLSKHIDLRFAVDNILNPEYKLEVGDKNRIQLIENSNILENYKRGVGYSLQLSYTF
ncbi:MAG: carboxypeptidase-like regulatory domain-containing protein [Bacteroidota bacterium]